MTHSDNFEKLLSHPHNEKFPNLVNLVMNFCPNITAMVYPIAYRVLETVTMNGNQMSDLVAENILKKFFSVRSLSFMNNNLTRLPNIAKFRNLTHLRLDNNNLNSENFFLAQLNGTGLQILTLSSCGLKNIKPGALEGLHSK
jgi:Leucine-rich repeat (LRR) protein